MKRFLAWFQTGFLTGLIIFNYTITTLISRFSLLKRAKKYLPLLLRKLFYNALITSILEYCCSVWGNTTNDNLIRLLRIQKCWARLILDINIYASSVDPYNKLGWIPIDDTIEFRKLFIIFNIMVNVLIIFDHYICYVQANMEIFLAFLIPRLVNVHFLQVDPDFAII